MMLVWMVQDMQGQGLDASGPSQVIFRLVVPNANCGSLIGKGGSNIRELREASDKQRCCVRCLLQHSLSLILSVLYGA